MPSEPPKIFDTEKAEIQQQPEQQKEFQKLVGQIAEITDQEVSESDQAIERRFLEQEQNYREAVREAGIDDVEALKKLEETTAPLRLKLATIRRKLKKATPFLISLVFATKLMHTETEVKTGSFNDRIVAEQQLKNHGITDEQKTTYVPGINDLLYRGITPVGYKSIWQIVKQFPENLITDRKEMTPRAQEDSISIRKKEIPEREDAWRLYLGLPQIHDTFGISEYKPELSKENKYYYKINNWFEKFSKDITLKEIVEQCTLKEKIAKLDEESLSLLRDIVEVSDQKTAEFKQRYGIEYKKDWTEALIAQRDAEWDSYKKSSPRLKEMDDRYNTIKLQLHELWSKRTPWQIDKQEKGYLIARDYLVRDEDGAKDDILGVMGQFKISLGQDEKGSYISYYDRWDLEAVNYETPFSSNLWLNQNQLTPVSCFNFQQIVTH